MDEYDPRQAPNRRIKRLIEADNNKARAREKTLYLQKLRELLGFMKLKDPRFQKFQQADIALKEARKREIEEERE